MSDFLTAAEAAALAKRIEKVYPVLCEELLFAVEVGREAEVLRSCEKWLAEVHRLGEWAVVEIEDWGDEADFVIPAGQPWHGDPEKPEDGPSRQWINEFPLLELSIVRRHAERLAGPSVTPAATSTELPKPTPAVPEGEWSRWVSKGDVCAAWGVERFRDLPSDLRLRGIDDGGNSRSKKVRVRLDTLDAHARRKIEQIP
ncbi:MAG: hypothetical protein AAGD32_06160 [Planctomycetota bacterium]